MLRSLASAIMTYLFPHRMIENPGWLSQWRLKHLNVVKKAIAIVAFLELLIEVAHLTALDKSLGLQPSNKWAIYRGTIITLDVICLILVYYTNNPRQLIRTTYFFWGVGVISSYIQALSIGWCVEAGCPVDVPVFFVGAILGIHVVGQVQTPAKSIALFLIGWIITSIPTLGTPLVFEYLSVGTAVLTLVATASTFYNLSLTVFISEKKTEMAMESLKLLDVHKNEFIQNVSHELRTPLSLLKGPLEDICNGDSSTEKALLALRNAQRLERLVGQFLEYQSTLMISSTARHGFVAIGSIVLHCVECFQHACDRRNIQFVVEHEGISLVGKDQPVIFGSQDHLEKIIFNYLSNAFKYTPDGGKIRLKLTVVGDNINIAVHDTGKGLSSTDLNQVFDLLYRGRNQENAHSREGSGLGLAIVRRLAEGMQGRANATSEQGYGSSFWVEIPLVRDIAGKKISYEFTSQFSRDFFDFGEEAAAKRLAENLIEVFPHHAAGETILVVDDEEDLRSYLTLLLTDRGYVVKVASNGLEALEVIKDGDIDLVITDIAMDTMDGHDLVGRLTEGEPTSGIPVIILSARTQPVHRMTSFERGSSFFMAKPFNNLELFCVIRNMLRLKEGEKEAELRREQTQALLRVLTHDLANTSSLIVGSFSGLKKLDLPSERAQEMIARGHRSIRRQIDIIKSVRDFDFIESGKAGLELVPVSIADMYLEIEDIFCERAAQKDINLELKHSLPKGHLVLGEPVSLLNSVFCNLVSNAIKFSNSGGKVCLDASVKDDTTIVIVKDSGIGIPDTLLSILFSPTESTTRPGTEGERGTGFGLPLVKKYLAIYGATISVESVCKVNDESNHGTTFTMVFKNAVAN